MFRFSTGLRDLENGLARATVHFLYVANTISFDNATSQIRDSASQFLAKGALIGDKVYGSGTAYNNTTFTITDATAGVLTVTPAPTTEAAGTIFGLAAATGGSRRDIMRNGVLYEYTGQQPTLADNAVGSVTLLRKWTKGGLEFVPGAAANGINLGISSGGILAKDTSEIWMATGLANGTSGWMRYCGNAADDGLLSTTLPRIDMSCGNSSSSADAKMGTTEVVLGDVYFMNNLRITFSYQYGV